MSKKEIIFFILLPISLFFYFISIWLSIFDSDFVNRYLILEIRFLLMVSVFLFYFWNKRKQIFSVLRNEKLELIFILTMAVLVNFLFLQKYPFVSVGDEVRDAGLDAMKIANGEITNFFGYGNYNGYGQIIPVFSSLFYFIFGNTVLTYRVPAAIISCLDIGLFYLLLRFISNQKTAIIGGFIYLSLPLHIFFSRTELVVIFDSFWTSAILLTWYVWRKNNDYLNSILLGTILGLSLGFHTAVRILALLVLGLAILKETNNFCLKRKFEKSSLNILLVLFFLIIGFGPRILQSNSETFLQSKRLMTKTDQIMNYETEGNKTIVLGKNYIRSLLVWFYEGTESRYPEHKPILSPILAMFFLTGIVVSVFILKDLFLKLLLILILILHFTNSAMTDWVNADHRLLPLITIGIVFTALGMVEVTNLIKNKKRKCIFLVFLLSFFALNIYYFFTKLPINKDKSLVDYLSMHSIYFIQWQNNLKNREICWIVSKNNEENLNLLHYKEQRYFFLPNNSVEIKADDRVGDNEIYISKNGCNVNINKMKFVEKFDCNLKENFYCPLNYFGEMKIYHQ